MQTGLEQGAAWIFITMAIGGFEEFADQVSKKKKKYGNGN